MMLHRRRVSLEIATDRTSHHVGCRMMRRLLCLDVESCSGSAPSAVFLLRWADVGLESDLRRWAVGLCFLPATLSAPRRTTVSEAR
ncbi:uncharacterized protein ColSpa_05991 [Colletotrichum spaethianum]|uniref:Uncharacterized protein n=1 Tax=Colletotrichum spaethianum TaxID=700344 RepID=A0AA37LFW5_9PEZI|nr:uncharacterized protein ColSpa_05991 [Colletotrichum spaethianum]GKT45810.1 hypothetical protein ColSpa_05991 [Colletotrichum spaethianum]